MKAIIATDGSARAIEAATAAEALLRDEIEFVLVTVVPAPEDPLDTAGGFEGPIFDEAEAERIAAADDEAGRDAIRATSRTVHDSLPAQLVHDDDPGAALCRLAQELSADLLVIGASEKNMLQRILHGSVMRHVVTHAPCPVLVVRHD